MLVLFWVFGWFQIGPFAGFFCVLFQLFTLFQDGIGAAIVDVGRVQVADPFVVVFVAVPLKERFQRPVEGLGDACTIRVS